LIDQSGSVTWQRALPHIHFPPSRPSEPSHRGRDGGAEQTGAASSNFKPTGFRDGHNAALEVSFSPSLSWLGLKLTIFFSRDLPRINGHVRPGLKFRIFSNENMNVNGYIFHQRRSSA
jgi:hypothetical protein